MKDISEIGGHLMETKFCHPIKNIYKREYLLHWYSPFWLIETCLIIYPYLTNYLHIDNFNSSPKSECLHSIFSFNTPIITSRNFQS